MKKLLLLVCSVFMLVGCENYTSSDVIESRWLSTTEKAVYKTWAKSSKYYYANEMMSIAKERRNRPNANPPDANVFFEDSVIQIRLIEVMMTANQERHTLSDVYRKVTGKDPAYLLKTGVAHNIDGSVYSDVSVDDVLQDIAKEDNRPADVATLRHLVEVAKNSNRAKVKMIVNNSESLAKMTQKEAEALIREYEVFQLETELDK